MRIIIAVSGVIFLYEAFSMIWPLRLPLWGKLAAAALLLAGAFKNSIYQRLGGGMFFAPDLPRWVMIAGSLLYNLLIVALFLLLVKDAVWLLWKLCARRPFPAAGASLLALVFAAALTAYGTWEAIRVPDVAERPVTIRGLAPEFEGLRVALLVDLHASALNRRPLIQAIVDRTMALKPDLILMPGDFVDGLVSQRREDLEPLAQLKAPLGVFGSSGNHEYYSGFDAWMKQLRKFGVTMLENEHRVLARGEGRLVLAGVPDQQGARMGRAAPDPDKALAGAPRGVPVILMAHRPEAARENAARGVALQVSGHTHGGMMPGLDRLVARFNGGFVKGWYDVGGMKLFNSPGTSLWNGFPLRLMDPAEITLLTLRAAP
ncbi:metallophosphoesterase [Pyramidobacter sp. CG50-2]|uniref:metallophosphoesterase n=1 Tax=Pyramidobacter sp. CG50-2 TaxID=2382160 RepID=UPI000EA01812|nr:metallophosphoesterase [Pyramidobacter sp. CG50-2]RKJ77121.1 metallophosphoesterase [Pyramidobacter sp. CG50-2]